MLVEYTVPVYRGLACSRSMPMLRYLLAAHRQDSAARPVRLTAVCLLQRNRPMLFHCEHGKDRTGIIAALILLCARVSKEHIKKVMLRSAP